MDLLAPNWWPLVVRLRFMMDIVAPVGGFHFVDAAPVPGRQWLRYVGDTSWFHPPLK